MTEKNHRASATRPFHPRLALVFDFDRTLGPDSIDALLAHVGIKDSEEFRREHVKPLTEDGWDPLLAVFYAIVQLSRREEGPAVTLELLGEVGRNLELYPGVRELFGRVRGWAEAIVPELDVEFYVLTCGLVQMHQAHPVAENFKTLWGSELHFADSGEADFVKQVVTFPEKVRYLLQLAKGLDSEETSAPADVYRNVPDEELHVPLSQIIYVGDGASDMPAFSLLNEHSGLALGVVQSAKVDDWDGYKSVHEGRRIENLAQADYSEGSELLCSLRLSVESIGKRIALRKFSSGE